LDDVGAHRTEEEADEMDDERELRERSEINDSGDDIEDTEWASDERLVSCGYVGDNLDAQRSPRFAPMVQAA
jgi:hypothetical protein